MWQYLVIGILIACGGYLSLLGGPSQRLAWGQTAPSWDGSPAQPPLSRRPQQAQRFDGLSGQSPSGPCASLQCGTPFPPTLGDGAFWGTSPPGMPGTWRGSTPLPRDNPAPTYGSDKPPLQDRVPWWQAPGRSPGSQ